MLNLKILIIQIGVILATSLLVGLAFRKINQPQVVGEMAAGILLGPSFLGWLAPDIAQALFPEDSLGPLYALGQTGLLLFMFLVGLKLDLRALRDHARTAVLISHTSILLPFGLGAALAVFLYLRLSNDHVSFAAFVLFMGAAMSVTAFPVLVRILSEHKYLSHKVRTVTIACAAVDDVTAWLILAFILVLVRTTDGRAAVTALVCTVIYTGLMVTVVRHLLRRLEDFHKTRGLTQILSTLILLLILASAFITEWLGIHILFGAFLAGLIMPKGEKLAQDLSGKFGSVTTALLLPLFFAFTGLRTSIALINSPKLVVYCAMISLVAVLGKLGGSMIAARATGMSWQEAGAIGTLMNTRGLMELVILNIGLEIGVISSILYSMMVLMALLTTFMSSPLLQWIYSYRPPSQSASFQPEQPESS